MATSPALFRETAPLVLTKPLPYIYTKLERYETLTGIFDRFVTRAFPKDSHWVLPVARSMAKKVAVTILDRHFYSPTHNLEERLAKYFADMEAFSSLQTLYISLCPEFVSTRSFDALEISGAPSGGIALWIVHKLKLVVGALSQVLPKTCEVVWRFDRACVPDISGDLIKRKKVLQYLEAMNLAMGDIWRQLGDKDNGANK